MATQAEQLRQAADAVACLGCSSADLESLSDAAVLVGQRQIAELRRLVETYAAWTAGTIARRSRPELGHSGLAAQQGFLSPEAMIQKVTGSSRGDAYKLVAVGTMMATTEAADRQSAGTAGLPGTDGSGDTGSGGVPGSPHSVGSPSSSDAAASWQAPIARAVAAGTLSVDAAESIRKGLGDIDTAVTAERLSAALATLIAEAAGLNADQCFHRARRLRDDLDTAGIAAREKQAHDDRYLRVYRLRDGKIRLHGLFAPEDGEFVLSTYDALTSPRRGGVRFVDKKRAAWAKRIQDDPRSTEQIAADSFIQLLKLGSEVDPGRMLGGRRPAVRVIVTQKDLTRQLRLKAGTPAAPVAPVAPVAPESPAASVAPAADDAPTDQLRQAETPLASPTGHGYLEGSPLPISLAAVERQICDTGVRGILFDDTGQALDVGREKRLFTEQQRAAMSLRDGGCLWPDCDRPPSWTEAHHIDGWLLDFGHTDLADGVCLCHPHHLLLHNMGWRIVREGSEYWLRPPISVDPDQTLIPLRSKSRVQAE
ncbi:DUF222 domain-containing protein [Cryobacterium sp. PH31-AA6]|uniref:DUF222 domain-containing protein n=1 Tax=Cryobacterium sp. PH31-AA6 TaxID=3046205 RepID=UPI0024BBDDF2|nr:HNH endonuclease signature motif containing protein [Cryobacterium sp. PH31-AA6]MDJ0323906.1 DUF222 domain-containing protein [Cryobacterium sp. PH31-AA6]